MCLCAIVQTNNTGVLSEADVRTRAAAQQGLPLTHHMLPGGALPYFPSLPVINSEFTPPNSPAYIAAQMKSLEQTQSNNKLAGSIPLHMPYTVPNNASPITDAQAAHIRLHRYSYLPFCNNSLSFLRECLEILGLGSPVYDWDPQSKVVREA